MEKIEIKKTSNFSKYAKAFVLPIQNGLQRFSNNIIIKSLVSGFVSAMPIVLVSSFFILIYAIPEAIDPNLVDVKAFAGFKAFAVRAYQFTYGILGLIVTGNIARAMMEELNIKLPFNKKVKTYQVFITAMIAYFIMSAIPSDVNFDPAYDSWFGAIAWQQMGAQGILPGIIIGLTTPWLFFYCYKYNVTIRLPKAVPGVISQSFLAVIPFAIAVLIWATISYGFIAGLGQPFIPWFFQQLSVIIPQLQYEGEILTADQFKQLPPEIQEEVATNALNSFANSYGMIVLFRFLETFSWFMGVHPEAIQGVFESMMAVNQEMNVVFNEIGREESFAFVNSLMGPTGNMGGTGSTFVVPIICLMFCRSTQSKVAGRTSAIPVAFQVNEPILFGQPIVLNPYFFAPFILVPIFNSVMAKVFVDNFGLYAAQLDLPWSIPWFIRGPVAQLGQPMVFLLLLICFLASFAIYLPFVLWYDKSLVKLEIEKVGKAQFVSMNGIQYQLNKLLSYDNNAHKKYLQEKRLIIKNYKLDGKPIELTWFNAYKNYNETTIKNLFLVFEKIKSNKIIKANEKYNLQVSAVNEKMKNKLAKMNEYNARLDAKIQSVKENEKILEKSFAVKIKLIELKKKTNPKFVILHRNFETDHKIKIQKIETNFLIRKNIILKRNNIRYLVFNSNTGNDKNKANIANMYNWEITRLKISLERKILDLEKLRNSRLLELNKILANYQNPFKLINATESAESDQIVKIDNNQFPNSKKELNVLVLCIGAGSSAMLANAINEGNIGSGSSFRINASALAYDQYKEALSGVDLIITSPQLGSYLPAIKADANELLIKVVPTKGKQYIDLSNNPKEASKFVIEQFSQEGNNV